MITYPLFTAKTRQPTMSILRIPTLILLTVIGISAASGRPSCSQPAVPVHRLYRHVEQRDSVSRLWKRLNASARLTQKADGTTLVIWNNWGAEKINPLVKVRIGPAVEAETHNGTVSRGSGSAERPCTVETDPELSKAKATMEWTIRTTDGVRRYRIARKRPRKR